MVNQLGSQWLGWKGCILTLGVGTLFLALLRKESKWTYTLKFLAPEGLNEELLYTFFLDDRSEFWFYPKNVHKKLKCFNILFTDSGVSDSLSWDVPDYIWFL